LEFENGTVKPSLIGVNFSARDESSPDFFGRCFGCQVKDEIVVLISYS